MIRRLFWLIAGVLLGVTGYRRIVRLARTLSPAARAADGRRGATPGRQRGQATMGSGWMRSVALFAHDVREGMDLYTDRHPRLAGHTLEGQQSRAQRQDRTSGADYAKEGR